MTTRSSRLGLIALTFVLAGVVGATPVQAQSCTPSFIASGSSYLSRLCGMPDYDQRRTAGIISGNGPTYNLQTATVGGNPFDVTLPGGGGCHCVPTSFSNLLGYYAGKGVKSRFPNGFNWNNRPGYVPRPDVAPNNYFNGQSYPLAEAQAYLRASVAIKSLGLSVKTGDAGCGTSWDTVLSWFQAFRPLFPEAFFSIYKFTPSTNAPKQVANILAAGGTVSIAYGRFENYTENDAGIATWGARKGGHAVTVNEVSGNGGNTATLKLHDPARNADPNEGGDKDRYRQSLTEARVINLKRVVNPSGPTVRWRYGDKVAEGNQAIWDSALVAYPMFAVMANGGQIVFNPGWSFNRTGTSAQASQVDPAPELRRRALNVGGTVLDAALLPATGEIAYIRRGDGSVRAIGVGTGERRVLGPAPKGATQLEPDQTGQNLFVGGSSEIVQFSQEGEVVKRLKAPAAVQALTFDRGQGFGDGKLVAVTADRGLHRLAPDTLTQIGAVQRLSRTLLQGSGPLATTVDNKGQLYLRRGSADRLGRVGLANRKVGRANLNALKGNGGFQLTERGSVLSVIDGKLAELTPNGAKVSGSPFAGLAARGRVLQVTRSGFDLTAAEATQIIDERVVDPNYPEMAP